MLGHTAVRIAENCQSDRDNQRQSLERSPTTSSRPPLFSAFINVSDFNIAAATLLDIIKTWVPMPRKNKASTAQRTKPTTSKESIVEDTKEPTTSKESNVEETKESDSEAEEERETELSVHVQDEFSANFRQHLTNTRRDSSTRRDEQVALENTQTFRGVSQGGMSARN